MKLVNKEAFMQPKKFKIVEVKINDGQDTVYVRELSAKQLDCLQLAMVKEVKTSKGVDIQFDKDNFRSKIVCACLCTEEGQPILDMKDAKALSENMRGADLNLIYDKSEELNHITQTGKDTDVKNS